MDSFTELEDMVSKISIGLINRNMSSRVESITCFKEQLCCHPVQLKTGQVKRLLKELFATFVENYFSEKLWKAEIYSLLVAVHKTDLSFSVLEYIVDEYFQSDSFVSKIVNCSSEMRSNYINLCSSLLTVNLQKGKLVDLDRDNLHNSLCVKLISIIGEQMDLLCIECERTIREKIFLRSKRVAMKLLSDFGQSNIAFFISGWIQLDDNNIFLSASSVLISYLWHRRNDCKFSACFVETKGKLNDFYRKRFVTAKQSAGLTSPLWRDILSFCVTSAEWGQLDGDLLQSTVLKTMKKAPEGSSHSVVVVLRGIDANINLNDFVMTGGGALVVVRMLKSSDELVRLSAVEIIGIMSGRCTSVDALKTLNAQLIEALSGKGVGGILTQTYQKSSMWLALSVSADRSRESGALNKGGLSAVASVTVTLLSPLMEKELDGNIRWLAANTLSKFMSLFVSSVDSTFDDFLGHVRNSLEKFVSAPTSSPGMTASSYLLVLSLSSGNNDEFMGACEKVLLPSLVGIVKDALKKSVNANSEAVLALALLLRLVNMSSTCLSLFETNKLWSAVSLPSSFLYSRVLQQQVSTSLALNKTKIQSGGFPVDVDASLLKEFLNLNNLGATCYSNQVVVSISSALSDAALNHPEIVMTPFCVDNNKKEASSALNFCILWSELKVREKVILNVKQLVQHVPKLVETLVEDLWTAVDLCGHQQEKSNAERILDFKNSISEDSDGKSVSAGSKHHNPLIAPPSYLIAALGAYLACAEPLSESTIAHSFLIVHHPFVCGTPGQALKLCTKLALQAKMTCFDTIFAKLDTASVSHTKTTREAVHSTMYSLANMSKLCTISRQIVFKLTASAVHRLQVSELHNLSAAEVLVFTDPDAALTEFVLKSSGSSTSIVDVQLTNADRKKTAPRSSRRGQFGADLADDEDWAERLKKEKTDKLLLSRNVESASIHDKATQEIAVARLVLKGKLDLVIFSLSLLEALAYIEDLSFCRSAICQLFEARAALTLIRSPLAQDVVSQTLFSLAKHGLEPHLQGLVRDAVDSLRIVMQYSTLGLIGNESLDEQQQDAYRHISRLSAPVLRLLRGVQVSLSRTTDLKSARMALLPSTVHILYPVLQEVLFLQAVIPGTEMTFFLLDILWPTANHFHSNSADVSTLRGLQGGLLKVLLRVMARPIRVDPAPDKVFLRVATQLTPLSSLEWSVLTGDMGLLSSEPKIRKSCWEAISLLVSNGLVLSCLTVEVLSKFWLGVHDDLEVVRAIAVPLWSHTSVLNIDFLQPLQLLLRHSNKHVREAAARAIAGLVGHLSRSDHQSSLQVIAQIQQFYLASLPAKPTVSSASKFIGEKGGMLLAPTFLKKPADDLTVGLRISLAQTILAIGVQKAIDVSEEAVLCDLLRFVLQNGAVDVNVDVRAAMLLAGKALVDCHGKELCGSLQRLLGEVLAVKCAAQEDVTNFDHRHSVAVVLLGATGRHLEKGDSSLLTIADLLVDALKTPSESVQRAVADCLAPLLQIMKGTERADELLELLLLSALEAGSYGDRRGAAFGLSAVIKGLGIPSLKQHDVVTRLKEACTNGSINSRQGSLFAFECLSERLGLLFEPYIIVVVPIMLKSFSHSSEHVRDAAQGAAMVIMSRLSAHGVKQVLTPILATLSVEPAWKSRQEAIRLLGMMAHCAPKQLAACLPQIVTCLVDVGSSDPHPKVKESAKAAMTDISSVIRNPEVARLSPVLLIALADPANKTKAALEALLECEFMHSIDAPSLALLIPILGRALRDRGADLKRKAAAITGNIMSMVSEPAALAPYLPQVLPGLKDCLMDPIPDVRASSSKALGSLFAGVGEEQLGDLVPWLVATLRSEVSPVERSGAAQGLSEICGHAMGPDRVEQILLLVMRMKGEVRSASREGLLWFLSFLPMTLNEGFAPYISVSLPVILSGLSDDNDGVREVAMRAGQVVVSKLGLNHTLKLLPSLADGMFHDDWRIRQSSIKLLGELLYLVGDTKAVGLADGEDDNEDLGAGNGASGSTSRVAITIRAHIGEKHTNEVLASLYIVRSDIATAVRQSALQIWKSIVSNTPRTLVEIMPVLVLQLIAKLSSEAEELRLVAGRALGELVRKLGDRVLPVIVPHIRQGLRSSQECMRQGACSGLSEILTACTKKQAEDYIEVLMPALRQALCDVSSNVCGQAAYAFMTLFKTVGVQAIDEVVPALLETLASGSDEAELALRGLREIVQLRPRDLVEYLLPTLLVSPMEYVSARALASVADVAGLQFNYHFQLLVPGLVHELYGAADKIEKLKVRLEVEAGGAEEEVDDGSGNTDLASDLNYELERFEAIKEAASAVMGSVGSSGVHLLISELGKQIEHETNVKRRRWGCWLTQQFVTRSKAEYEDYVTMLLKFVLSRVAELDNLLLQEVSDCLLAISVRLPLEELAEHMSFICSCISSAASAARHRTGTAKFLTVSGEFLLPLLTLPKSFDPLLNIALYGLMNGSANVRAACAEAIGELAVMTDAAVLKPVLIKTTGPLIRVIGDRYPSNVKAAILQALIVLLEKGGASLKAFAPQLQTTFVKSLSDPSREVRLRGGTALGKLMTLSLRVDPLLVELSGICLQADSNAIKGSVLDAIASVLVVGGEKATVTALDKVKTVVLQNVGDEDDNIRAVTARCVSGLSVLADVSQATDFLLDLLDSGSKDSRGETAAQAVGRLNGVAALLQSAGQRALEMREEAFAAVSAGLRDERSSVKVAACEAVAVMILPPSHNGWQERKAEYRSSAQATIHAFASSLGAVAQDGQSGEVRTSAITAIKQAAKFYFGATVQHLKEFLPAINLALKDINIQVKYIAERALKHLSEGGSGSANVGTLVGTENAAFSSQLSTMDPETSRFVRDYLKRVVNRLPADSDDEAADKW